jgi:Brp/Blh family beta-carotene 15,15'-monooxygenase
MGKPTFLFIVSLLFSFPFLSGGVELSMENQFLISMLLVFTIGIAHGSVDNILYLDKSTIKPLTFYLVYLFLVAVYATIWFIFPIFAISSFLLISAYHFGQSQLTDCFKNTRLINRLLYISWGFALLSALLNIQFDEILAVLQSYSDLQVFASVFVPAQIYNLHVVSTAVTVTLLIYLAVTKQVKVSRMGFEFFLLILLNVSFAALPALLGFTMYFVFLHSLKVLEDEFKFLEKKDRVHVLSFIKKLIPNTVISIAGTLIIFAGIHFDYINLSYGFILLVLISSITFPHVFVMEKFYAPNA